MHRIALSILPGDLVFDFGAHSGEKAAWFVGLGARVVCVEPQPALVQKLNDRFGSNSQVSIIPKGVASRCGKLKMSINSGLPVLSTFSDQWKRGRFSSQTWDQTVEVEMTTFDQLISEFGTPRYTKVDVEGFELEVVKGLSSKAGCISFEFTTEFLANTTEVVYHLLSIGYSKFNLSLGEDDGFLLDAWSDIETFLPVLNEACSRASECWGDIYAV